MRIRSSFVLALLLITARAIGQDRSTTHGKQPSMEVATVILTVGLPRDKVLAEIQHAGYRFLELPSDRKEFRVGLTLGDIDDPVKKAMVLTSLLLT